MSAHPARLSGALPEWEASRYNSGMSPCLPSRAARGYTLMELLVVIAVTGVIVAMALPSFTRLRLSNSRAAGTQQLMAALLQARSEAIARNASVTLCRRKANAESPNTPTCGDNSSGAWARGWILRDASNAVIAVFEPVGSVSTDSEQDFRIYLSGTNAGIVTLQSNGRPTEAVNFTICEKKGRLSDARRVSLNLSGHTSLQSLTGTTASTACPVT